jgi:hypothetical protein
LNNVKMLEAANKSLHNKGEITYIWTMYAYQMMLSSEKM